MQQEHAKNAPYQNMSQQQRYPGHQGNFQNQHPHNNHQNPNNNNNNNMGYNYPAMPDSHFPNNHHQNPNPLYIEPEGAPFFNDNSSYGRVNKNRIFYRNEK